MARTTEQNQQMREKKKSQILKEALKQFSKKGLHATKIKDIAASVGMAQGLLYNYYKSKEEIYIELVCSSLDKMNEAVDKLDSRPLPPDKKITDSLEEIIETIKKSDDFNQTCHLVTQSIETLNIAPEVQQLILEKREYPYKVISKIMKEGQSCHTIIDGNPEQLAVLYWTLINGMAIYKTSRKDVSQIPDPKLISKFFIRERNKDNG